MFAPRTTPKNELTFHKEVTTMLRHTIEGPINGVETWVCPPLFNLFLELK